MSRAPPSEPNGSTLHLTLHGQTDPRATADSLLRVMSDQHLNQKIIQELHLTVDTTFHVGALMTEPGREMMRAFGTLPHLKTMIIRGQFRAPFPVTALSRFFSAARGLVRFSLFQMTLVGKATDFERFGLNAVSRHIGSLEVFDIDMIQILRRPRTPPAERPALDPLFKALNQSQELQVLLLGGSNPVALNGAVSPLLILELFRSKTIQRLSLVNFPISLCRITKALETNDCLKHLCLSYGSTAAAGEEHPTEATEAAFQAKRPSNTKHLYGSRATPLSYMLKRNKTLQQLILFLPRLDQDEDLLLEIFRSVEESETLKGFFLGSLERMSARSKEALMRMLQKNFVLEEFGFVCANQSVAMRSQSYPCSVDAIREMTMLLRLNKHVNRGRLLQDENATREEWAEALITVRDDVDCIFHLLSGKPTLLDPGLTKNGSRATGKASGRKRSRNQAYVVTSGNPSRRKRLYRAVKYTGVSYR